MSEEATSGSASKKSSVKSYATNVFKESSVKVISSIATTGSNPRKIFRAVVFLLFTAGFLYQCIKFLAYVFTYPTVLTLEIIKPDTYMLPAYTFCNYNKVKRSKFCEKYPDRCFVPDFEFCEDNPNYCQDNKTVPKEEFYGFPQSFKSPEEVLEFSHDLKDLLTPIGTISFRRDRIDGPFVREQDWSPSIPASCFTYHSRVNNNLVPDFGKRDPLKPPDFPNDVLVFNPEENEKFNPYSEVGIALAIHSPYEAVNPFKNGIFLRPNHNYYISVSMSQEMLLKYPYKTDCLNYTERWLENGKSGPRSQEMCRQFCMHEHVKKCYNCSYYIINYPPPVGYCRLDERTPTVNKECLTNEKKVLKELSSCVEKCKDECWKMKYEYRFEEKRDEKVFGKKGKVQEITQKYISVYIDFEDNEIYSFEYKSQYQEVETFSYIGGFIGIWLGISLVEVADFFESTFRITRYFFRKGSNKCLKTPASA